MTVEEKAYNYASKVVKNRLTASEVAAHYGRGYIEGQEDMKQLGWHPASELPPKEGELVLVFRKTAKNIGAFGAIFSNGEYYVESVLNDPDMVIYDHISIKDVKWWCYPPKEE